MRFFKIDDINLGRDTELYFAFLGWVHVHCSFSSHLGQDNYSNKYLISGPTARYFHFYISFYFIGFIGKIQVVDYSVHEFLLTVVDT